MRERERERERERDRETTFLWEKIMQRMEKSDKFLVRMKGYKETNKGKWSERWIAILK